MGIGPNFEVSAFDYDNGVRDGKALSLKKTFPNPNPLNCLVVKHEVIGQFLIVVIKYPDCSTFEGNKILVYENVTIDELTKQSKQVGIDPHFSASILWKSPVARFVPTENGWDMAKKFAWCLHYLLPIKPSK